MSQIPVLLHKDNILLKGCSTSGAFWTVNGAIINNLPDLIYEIKKLNEYEFRYHVNEDRNKNDFADWIRAVFGDIDLALKLEGVMNKKKYLHILSTKLKKLTNK